MTTLTTGAVLAVVILALLAYDRIRYGKPVSHGSSKANTVHAIEQANSPLYRSMILADVMIDMVLADMLDNPNDIINN